MSGRLETNKLMGVAITLALILATTGCKLRITVPEGGQVVWGSGAYRCEMGNTCDIDVVDFYFDETFVADPIDGYFLRYWEPGERRFCGRSPLRSCDLGITGLSGYGLVEPFLASDEVFHLQPRFERGDCTERPYDSAVWRLVELYQFQYRIRDTYLECNIPNSPEPVKHGQYVSSSRGNDVSQYPEGSICVSTYDLGTLTEQWEYNYWKYETIQPYVTKHLTIHRNGTSELIHSDGMHVETGRETFTTPVVAC